MSRPGLSLLLVAVVVAGVMTASLAAQIPIAQARVPRIDVPQASLPRRMTPEKAAAFVEAARRGLNYLPGEVVVKFRSGSANVSRQRALDTIRSRPDLAGLEWHGEVAIVRDPTQPDAYALAAELNAQPEIEYAEPNFIARIDPLVKAGATGGSAVSNRIVPARMLDRMAARFSGSTAGPPSDTDFGTHQWNFTLLRMPAAWDVQPGGRSDLIVAVVDTGITIVNETRSFPVWTGSTFQTVAYTFTVNQDLPATRLVAPRDFAFLDPAGPVLDLDGHGTHVSGTIGQATNNGLLVAGMAYNVRIMPVKVCAEYWDIMFTRAVAGMTGFIPTTSGGCSFADIADGIRYAADNGAKVINISLGGTSPSTTMRDALAYAVGRGVFVAISMGNNFETGNPTVYPARYAMDFDGVMAVASTNKNNAKSYYSSTGLHCEVAAPGGDMRQGTGQLDRGMIWQSTLIQSNNSPLLLIPRFDGYDKQSFQGTSMAAPHVAGLAALIRSQHPTMTAANVERLIRETAMDLGPTGKDDQFGHGLLQPRAALYGRGIR